MTHPGWQPRCWTLDCGAVSTGTTIAVSGSGRHTVTFACDDQLSGVTADATYPASMPPTPAWVTADALSGVATEAALTVTRPLWVSSCVHLAAVQLYSSTLFGYFTPQQAAELTSWARILKPWCPA
jgi:hypothetical protein